MGYETFEVVTASLLRFIDEVYNGKQLHRARIPGRIRLKQGHAWHTVKSAA